MADTQTLSCQCGATEWTIDTSSGTRVVCYCADCQTFARHLSPNQPQTDAAGGTHVYQTLPENIHFTRNANGLSALRLSPNGLIRWYTACCRTPVANTLPRTGIPFAGLVLPPETPDFGKIVAHAFTDSARRPVKGYGMPKAGLSVLFRALSGRIAGAHRKGPFVDADGELAVTPTVLTREERSAARPR